MPVEHRENPVKPVIARMHTVIIVIVRYVMLLNL